MEMRLNQRVQTAAAAVKAFKEILMMDKTDVVRDAAIQRFEFSFEACWKLANAFLAEKEGIENNSPKSVIRSCFEIGLLNEDQTHLALQMTDDRNLTVHTYNESLVENIFTRLNHYADLLAFWLSAVADRL